MRSYMTTKEFNRLLYKYGKPVSRTGTIPFFSIRGGPDFTIDGVIANCETPESQCVNDRCRGYRCRSCQAIDTCWKKVEFTTVPLTYTQIVELLRIGNKRHRLFEVYNIKKAARVTVDLISMRDKMRSTLNRRS